MKEEFGRGGNAAQGKGRRNDGMGGNRESSSLLPASLPGWNLGIWELDLALDLLSGRTGDVPHMECGTLHGMWDRCIRREGNAALPWECGSPMGMRLFQGKIPPGNEPGSIPEPQAPRDGMWIPAGNARESQGSARILGAKQRIQGSQNPGIGVRRDFTPFQYPPLLQPSFEHSRDGVVTDSPGISARASPPSSEEFL